MDYNKEQYDISFMESICDYNQFISYVKEELIRTLTSDEVIELLDRRLDRFNFRLIRRHKTQFKIEINEPDKDLSYYKYIFSICLRCGYYCSFYKILTDDYLVKFKGEFDKNKFIDIIEKYNIKQVELIFEGDYEDREYTNIIDIPEILYHLTPNRNKNSILKIGLAPKGGSRLSYHPERIYLMDNLKNYQNLIEEFRYEDFKYHKEKYKNKKHIESIDDMNSDFYKYMLLEIDTTINNLNEKLILNTDPNYNLYGYFTTNNIPKENIKILEENL